ncbi:NAD(P)-binding protein [Ophiobolus disseminans]|uniref:NAD(P)-binding protein n=1 Tax=Ophiobolus disseminans TaxID=1469910 RepID=A0A6A6ZWP8_9PLEO|nr:NAD(P)-binding protein [Ophiobolus disseminans]
MSKRSGPLAPGIAFVTGGARGLGNAIAVSFAKEGARGVVLVDVADEATFQEGKKAVEELGTECLTIHADVTREPDMQRAVSEAVERFSRIDYAANFAGIFGSSDTIADMNLDAWQKTQDVNSTGILIATKYEMRQMMTQSSIDGIEHGRVPQCGSIINCASVNSLQTMSSSAAYTASKHACAGITKVAALEGRAHNIRVNAVSPGFLLTALVKPIEGTDTGRVLWEGFEKRQGRKAVFEEVGDVVVLMSLPRMSLVNGHNLFIDNGFTINEGQF